MEFRKMVMITRYARQQKRNKCIEQTFGLCGRGRRQDDLGEWHWNTYNIIYEMNRQSRCDTWYWILGAGALRWPRGMIRGGRRVGGSGWGTGVYLRWIHVDVKKKKMCLETLNSLWKICLQQHCLQDLWNRLVNRITNRFSREKVPINYIKHIPGFWSSLS